jgi:hypothetical protein
VVVVESDDRRVHARLDGEAAAARRDEVVEEQLLIILGGCWGTGFSPLFCSFFYVYLFVCCFVYSLSLVNLLLLFTNYKQCSASDGGQNLNF